MVRCCRNVSPGGGMEKGRPSTTATVAAMIRAAHLLWDEAPKILQDPLALGLSGVESPDALQAMLRARQAEPYNYAGVLVRQRYAEDELATAMQRGVGQYVILGAGLDSFAYRRPDLATLLRVFEGFCRKFSFEAICGMVSPSNPCCKGGERRWRSASKGSIFPRRSFCRVVYLLAADKYSRRTHRSS